MSASTARARDMDVDYSERNGFLTGKAAAIADWQFRKAQNEGDFAALCNRLYKRNWARRARQSDPLVVRARLKRWRDANREKVRAADRARRAKAHVAPVNRCHGCGAQWSPIYGRSRRAKWCSTKCRNHHHGVARARARNRGLRDMSLTATILAVLRAAPRSLSAAAIHKLAPTLKRGSLATRLSTMTTAGVLQNVRGNYSIVSTAALDALVREFQ